MWVHQLLCCHHEGFQNHASLSQDVVKTLLYKQHIHVTDALLLLWLVALCLLNTTTKIVCIYICSSTSPPQQCSCWLASAPEMTASWLIKARAFTVAPAFFPFFFSVISFPVHYAFISLHRNSEHMIFKLTQNK